MPCVETGWTAIFILSRVSLPIPATFQHSRIALFSGVMLPRGPQVGAAGRKHPAVLSEVPDEARNRPTLSSNVLAAALLKLLSDAKECHRIGENCRTASSNFSGLVL